MYFAFYIFLIYIIILIIILKITFIKQFAHRIYRNLVYYIKKTLFLIIINLANYIFGLSI